MLSIPGRLAPLAARAAFARRGRRRARRRGRALPDEYRLLSIGRPRTRRGFRTFVGLRRSRRRGCRCSTCTVRVVVQPILDHLERKEVLALLAQDPAESLDVVLVELPVARRRPFRIDQTLALEEPDLRDGDVGKLLAEKGEHVSDREVRPRAHRPLRTSTRTTLCELIRPAATRKTSLNLPIWTSSPLLSWASSIRSRFT